LATDDEESNDNVVIVSSRAFVPPCNLQPWIMPTTERRSTALGPGIGCALSVGAGDRNPSGLLVQIVL